jgi:hypothetical protein
MQHKKEILTRTLEAKLNDVLLYQTNIDNYAMGIERIDSHYSGKPGMDEFREKLSELLETEKIEQMKTQVMVDVIERQLEEACT